jgi:hypothetical protein
LGRRAFSYACEHWLPEKIESQYVDIYKSIMAKRSDLDNEPAHHQNNKNADQVN